MAKIWEFYENLDEIVYVSDADSFELIYMNKKALEIYGFSSIEEISGKKCYEVLHNSKYPCTNSIGEQPKPGYFKEWQDYNPALDKDYAVKCTIVTEEGRRCRMIIAVDMTVEGHEGSAYDRQDDSMMSYSFMLHEGLRIALAASSPEKSIRILLGYLGQMLGCEEVYIYEADSDGGFLNTYNWREEETGTGKNPPQKLPEKVSDFMRQSFQEQEYIHIKSVQKLGELEPEVCEFMQSKGILAMIAFPLVKNESVIGFYGVNDPQEEFLQHIMFMFQVMGDFINSLFSTRDLVKRLETISFYDQLTGIGNRHAMNEYVREIQADSSIGVVYCDVMGLKRINDNEGHQAGDALIKRACDCLKQAFGEYDLFRMGGDEFLVMCAGITEQELHERTEELVKKMRKNAALMAIGSIWRPCSDGDFKKLLAEADDRMYENKRAYYAAHPGEERRSGGR